MGLVTDHMRNPDETIGNCEDCGHPVIEDASPGVMLHATGNRDLDHDLDEDHVARAGDDS